MSHLNEQSLPRVDIDGSHTSATHQATTSQGFASRRWLYLIPLIFITYSLAYLDRANYGFASAAMVTVSWASDKSGQRKAFIWPLLAVGALAFFCSYLLGSTHFWLSFALLTVAAAALYAPYGPFFALIPEILPANVFGGAIGLINACGALGAFAGSWIVGHLIGLTGNPGAAYIFMTLGVLSSALLMAWVKVRR